jgi:hypothetical protein
MLAYAVTSPEIRHLFVKLSKPGVAVEKLLPAKSAKIKSRQDALQTTFSVFLDIFYPPNFGHFEEMDFFNTHRRLHSEPGRSLPTVP